MQYPTIWLVLNFQLPLHSEPQFQGAVFLDDQRCLRPESRSRIGVGFCQKALVTAALEPLALPLPSPSCLSFSSTDPSIVWKFLAKTATHNKSNGLQQAGCLSGASNLPPRRCRVASATGNSVNTAAVDARAASRPVKLVRARSGFWHAPKGCSLSRGPNFKGVRHGSRFGSQMQKACQPLLSLHFCFDNGREVAMIVRRESAQLRASDPPKENYRGRPG